MPAHHPEEHAAKPLPAARKQPSSLDYVQQALKDLDKARGRATDEVRHTVDTAIERLRKASSEMRDARR